MDTAYTKQAPHFLERAVEISVSLHPHCAAAVEYQGWSRVGWRDLMRLRDLDGRRIGTRFLCYLGRGAAYDFVSLTRKRGALDWVRLATTVVGFIGACGGAAP
jgi:hypothetical protein